MEEKQNWCVEGIVKLLGIGGKVYRKEFTHAKSRSQALLQIGKRLSGEYKQDVYLGDCQVLKVDKDDKKEKQRKQKPMEKQALYQLDLFSSVPKRVA